MAVFGGVLEDLERAAKVMTGIDIEAHRQTLRAAANVVEAARSAVYGNDLPGGNPAAMSHLAETLRTLEEADS